jgi:uncharacterized membrane protein
VYTIVVEVVWMLKNITLSADEKLIESARKKALLHNTTLNELFRQWLANYSVDKELSTVLDQFLIRTSYCAPGRSFNREELNER